MSRKLTQLVFLALFLASLMALTQTTRAQAPANPTPAGLGRPDYNYSESDGCTRCHFVYGAKGDHNLEAVGVQFDDAKKVFSFTGSGWRASAHSQSNYASTQNTYCAKCHSPLQAKAESSMNNREAIANGKVEGVTCAACHPSHNSAVTLGRRLGIYQFGMDKNTPEAYKVIHEGEEDTLCLNCHNKRHNEGNAAFDLMYVAGVRCIDCHMAVYGTVLGTETSEHPVEKRAHDFKVAKNLPYSCGVEGSVIHCHPEFSAESTREFIPYMKDQHREMWPKMKETKRLKTAADYLKLWKQLEAEVGR